MKLSPDHKSANRKHSVSGCGSGHDCFTFRQARGHIVFNMKLSGNFSTKPCTIGRLIVRLEEKPKDPSSNFMFGPLQSQALDKKMQHHFASKIGNWVWKQNITTDQLWWSGNSSSTELYLPSHEQYSATHQMKVNLKIVCNNCCQSGKCWLETHWQKRQRSHRPNPLLHLKKQTDVFHNNVGSQTVGTGQNSLIHKDRKQPKARSWHNAHIMCMIQNGQLPSITSQDDLTYFLLTEEFQRYFAAELGIVPCFIGLHKKVRPSHHPQSMEEDIFPNQQNLM